MKRELFEETGYQADDAELQLLSIDEFVSPRGDPITYVTYHAKLGTPHEMVLEESAPFRVSMGFNKRSRRDGRLDSRVA